MESVDILDLKSGGQKPCGFKSRLAHHPSIRLVAGTAMTAMEQICCQILTQTHRRWAMNEIFACVKADA